MCHANDNDSVNPYVFHTPNYESAVEAGHFDHYETEARTWDRDVWWNGTYYEAGSVKRDFIGDFTLDGELREYDGIVTAEFCNAVAIPAQLVTPNVTWNEPSCQNGNAAGFTGEFDGSRVEYEVTGGSLQPGAAVEVTASAKVGWRFADHAQTVFTHEFDDAADCRGIAVPEDPAIIDPTCSTELQVEAASLPGEISYDVAVDEATRTVSVTATVVDGFKLPEPQDMPDGWTRVSDSVATYTDTYTVPAACPGDGGDPTEVTALKPDFIEPGCTTDPRIEYREVTGVSYGYTGDMSPQGTVTVTAVALEDFVLKAGEAASWSHTFKARPAGAACGNGGGNTGGPVEDPTQDVDQLVSPRYPSATAADCSRDGRLVVPTQGEGVLVQQTGTAPGDVTFTFSPATGHAFPAGTDTEVTVTVPAQLTGEDCIRGVQTSRPKPQPGTGNPGSDGPATTPAHAGGDAEVLGEQAVAVPTAVAAGLGDTMTATSAPASPQLAQALVAAGLLMLVAGGATGLGRRTRGAHES